MDEPASEAREPRVDGYGTCARCAQTFPYCLIHNGFNDTAYAYCDTCGCTALLDWYTKRPDGVPYVPFERISKDVERYLQPCRCGGHFTADAEPRCLHCKAPLSATDAATWIEANAPGTAKGWHWQRNWNALYAIIIGGRVAHDPWLWPGALE